MAEKKRVSIGGLWVVLHYIIALLCGIAIIGVMWTQNGVDGLKLTALIVGVYLCSKVLLLGNSEG